MKDTIKTINMKQYKMACEYLLQMYSDSMITFDDYCIQLDKLGNMFLKKVDAPNIITTILTTIVKGKGEEVLVADDEDGVCMSKAQFRKQWYELEEEWLQLLGINE